MPAHADVRATLIADGVGARCRLAWLWPPRARGGYGRPALCASDAAEQAASPYLAIVSAPAELAPIVAAAVIENTVQIGSRPYYQGRLGGASVLLGLTGIGIVNATATARSLLARKDVAGLIMRGTAGTRHHIGDVVLASELVEPDRPGTFHPNPALVAVAHRADAALPEALEKNSP